MYSGYALLFPQEHRVVATPAHRGGHAQGNGNQGDDDDVEQRRHPQESFEVLVRTMIETRTQKKTSTREKHEINETAGNRVHRSDRCGEAADGQT